MSTQEVDHSTPALHSFAQAADAASSGFAAYREAWPKGSRMGSTSSQIARSMLYVTNAQHFVVTLTDEDRAANDWIIVGPRRPI